LRPIYTAEKRVIAEPVIARITEIELELIEYLRKHPELLREMHSDAFEKLVAELLASNGFKVEWTGRNRDTAGDVIAFRMDAGLDLLENYLVECKRYGPNRPVELRSHEPLWCKAREGFSNALLVTTSTFQDGVERFAMRRWDFHLKDYDGLVKWLPSTARNEMGGYTWNRGRNVERATGGRSESRRTEIVAEGKGGAEKGGRSRFAHPKMRHSAASRGRISGLSQAVE